MLTVNYCTFESSRKNHLRQCCLLKRAQLGYSSRGYETCGFDDPFTTGRICGKSETVSGGQSKELKNWTVYSFPVDYSFIKNKNYQDTKILPAIMPPFSKRLLRLDKVGDTFLDEYLRKRYSMVGRSCYRDVSGN